MRNILISNVWNVLVLRFLTAFVMFLGLEEEGLYRISGATSDIQRLKKKFEKS